MIILHFNLINALTNFQRRGDGVGRLLVLLGYFRILLMIIIEQCITCIPDQKLDFIRPSKSFPCWLKTSALFD